eukprot:TRINITY_DN41862_c0_g1_i1.p1 TRINITY_DN41862_c0_g1~~TRINITY_DN41862_c0_g1_i1.p1  ORF type:complete len:663 (-),score=176.17 TRINITY_DN41862_c0_g1_i1:184-2172(-)
MTGATLVDEADTLRSEVDRLRDENARLREVLVVQGQMDLSSAAMTEEGAMGAANSLIMLMQEGGQLLKEREALEFERAKLVAVKTVAEEDDPDLERLMVILREVDNSYEERQRLCADNPEMAIPEGDEVLDALARLRPLMSESDNLLADREKLMFERKELAGKVQDAGMEWAVDSLPIVEDRDLEMRLNGAMGDVLKENASLKDEILRLKENNSKLKEGVYEAAERSSVIKPELLPALLTCEPPPRPRPPVMPELAHTGADLPELIPEACRTMSPKAAAGFGTLPVAPPAPELALSDAPGVTLSASEVHMLQEQLQEERRLREAQAESFSAELTRLQQELRNLPQAPASPVAVHREANQLKASPPPPAPPKYRQPLQEEPRGQPLKASEPAPEPPAPYQQLAVQKPNEEAPAPPAPPPPHPPRAEEDEGSAYQMEKAKRDMHTIMKQAPKKAAAPQGAKQEEVQPAPPPPCLDKEEEELPPLEDLPEPELLKAAAPPVQEKRPPSKELPRALPTPQAHAPAAPAAEHSATPAMQASVLSVPTPPPKVRQYRSPEELLKEAGVPLDPEAMLRALLMPSAQKRHMHYPEASEPEPEDPELVKEQRQEAMAKLLSNKLVPEHAAAEVDAPEEDAMSPEQYDEELHMTQEHAMKGALHTLFRSFAS